MQNGDWTLDWIYLLGVDVYTIIQQLEQMYQFISFWLDNKHSISVDILEQPDSDSSALVITVP